MKKILYAGAEVMPFGATGGLGDVLGSLPAAIVEECKGDADVRVVMPLYKAVKDEWRAKMKDEGHSVCGTRSTEGHSVRTRYCKGYLRPDCIRLDCIG